MVGLIQNVRCAEYQTLIHSVRHFSVIMRCIVRQLQPRLHICEFDAPMALNV